MRHYRTFHTDSSVTNEAEALKDFINTAARQSMYSDALEFLTVHSVSKTRNDSEDFPTFENIFIDALYRKQLSEQDVLTAARESYDNDSALDLYNDAQEHFVVLFSFDAAEDFDEDSEFFDRC
jgi:hypothetical protein